MTDIVVVSRDERAALVDSYVAASVSEGAAKWHRRAWDEWVRWADAHGACAMPAVDDDVAAWAIDRCASGARPSYARRIWQVVGQVHRHAGQPDPTATPRFRAAWRAVMREHLGARTKEAAPVLPELLRLGVLRQPPGLMGTRNRALLLVGWWGALRCAELRALRVCDVVFDDAGILLELQSPKSQKDGTQKVRVPRAARDATLDAPRALQSWFDVYVGSFVLPGDTRPLFPLIANARWASGAVTDRPLSHVAVSRIVRQAAGWAGLDVARYSGHSLRSGLVTFATMRGVPSAALQRHTRHQNASTLARYARDLHTVGGGILDGLL